MNIDIEEKWDEFMTFLQSNLLLQRFKTAAKNNHGDNWEQHLKKHYSPDNWINGAFTWYNEEGDDEKGMWSDLHRRWELNI